MFSAQCTQGKYLNEYLSFHSFLVNIGNDFDLSSGTFTTPITGIYELSLSGYLNTACCCGSGCAIHTPIVEIMKNNEKVVSYYKNYNQYGIYGPTWLLPLHKGDKIRIHYSNIYSHYLYRFQCGVDTPGIFNGKYLGPM